MLLLELLASCKSSLLNINQVSSALKLSLQTVNRFLYVLEKSFHNSEREIKFWHTKGKREIDFIIQGKKALEVKYSASQFKEKQYKIFKENYPEISLYCASYYKREKGIAVWEI